MRMILLAMLLVMAGGCSKKETIQSPAPVPSPAPTHPAMTHIDFNDVEIIFNQPQHIDLDADGRRDFTIGTLHVADPVLDREIVQFMVTSAADRFVQADANDKAPLLNYADSISGTAVTDHIWYEIGAPVLVEKIIELSGAIFWQGPWMNASHKYFPFYMKKNGLPYYGWFEVTMDISTEKVTLHRAAVCKEAGRAVRAGY